MSSSPARRFSLRTKIALALNGDELNTIHGMDDAASPAFENARRILDLSRRINGLAENEVYVLRPVMSDSPFETEFVVMLQKETFVSHRYTVPAVNRRSFLQA